MSDGSKLTTIERSRRIDSKVHRILEALEGESLFEAEALLEDAQRVIRRKIKRVADNITLGGPDDPELSRG